MILKKILPTQKKPFSDKVLIKILIGIIIALAFLAGYYHSLWSNLVKYQTNYQESGVVITAQFV